MEERKVKKKVLLPSRGYYSEIITDPRYSEKFQEEFPGARKKTKLLWQIRTEKHAPIIRQMNPPEKGAFLAPAERWMTFEDDKHVVSMTLSLAKKWNMPHLR